MSVTQAGDLAAYEAMFHPDVAWRSPAFDCVGAAAVRQRYNEILAAVPDYESKVRTWAVDVIADRAVFKLVQTGTVARDLVGTAATFPASPAKFVLHSVMAVQFDESGLITKVQMYFDPREAGGEQRADHISA